MAGSCRLWAAGLSSETSRRELGDSGAPAVLAMRGLTHSMADTRMPDDAPAPDTDEPFDHPAEWRPDVEVCIGPVSVPKELLLDVVVRRYRQGGTYRRVAEIVINAANDAVIPHWSYRDRVVLREGGQPAFTGFIDRAGFAEPDRLMLIVHDAMRLFELTHFKSLGYAGLTGQEVIHLTLRLAGWPEELITGLNTESALRPFFFAIPLENVAWTTPEEQPALLDLGPDMFVFRNDDSNLRGLKALLVREGRSYVDECPQWMDATPKLGGAVAATGFPEARLAALRRAQVAIDCLSATAHLASNRIGVDGLSVLNGWDLRLSRTRPRLSSSLFLRDIMSRHDRFVVFDSEPVKEDRELELASCEQALGAVTALLGPILHEGRITRPGAPAAPEQQRKRREAHQRALHWLTIGRGEALPGDALLAYWFALETLVAAEPSDELFSGPNRPIRDQLKRAIRQLEMPPGATVTKDLLSNRLLNNDPPLMQKLRTLCLRAGVALPQKEYAAIKALGTMRGGVVHGRAEEGPTADDLHRLEHLVERLLFAEANRSTQPAV